jgi:hypothetical protein
MRMEVGRRQRATAALESLAMLKFFKSSLLWQISSGFVLGTIGMIAMAPADASPLAALFPTAIVGAR